VPRTLHSWDLLIPVVLFALGALGVVLIHTASGPAGPDGIPEFGGPAARQLAYLAVALLVFIVAVAVPYHVWSEFAGIIYLAGIALLVLTVTVGHEANGARSWLVAGPFRLQPSEPSKISTALFAASYVASRGAVDHPRRLTILALAIAVPVGLIVLQNDLGTALTFMPLFAVLAFAGGIPARVILVLAIIGALALPVMWVSVLEDYQKERILTVFDPSRDPSDSGWQIHQSRIAVGSGEVTGKGLYSGTQGPLRFLPEAHTDFIFAVLAEQAGFLGVLAVLLAYFLLIWGALQAAVLSRDALGMYLCLGIAAVWCFQIFLNVGMVAGLVPTIGIPLPVLSSGGSSMVTTFFAFGLVVNVRQRRLVN
jgi:rod shape determining protein RodA